MKYFEITNFFRHFFYKKKNVTSEYHKCLNRGHFTLNLVKH